MLSINPNKNRKPTAIMITESAKTINFQEEGTSKRVRQNEIILNIITVMV
jgi:hypothetical protein